MKEILRLVIKEQNKQTCLQEIERSIPKGLLENQEILVISGLRRSGKSVLLQQIRKRQNEQSYFINFDDERLINFQVEHFQLLHEVFIEMYGEQKTFYFDEIQNIIGWERFVRRLYDAGNKIFITGSNATMLSRELGTHLTGRYIRFELYPFSFKEFITFKNKKIPEDKIFTTSERGEITGLLQEYISNGGIPLFLKTKQDLYIKQLYESILYKDVLVRNKINNEKEILQLVYYLASNVAKPSTNKSLCSVIGVKTYFVDNALILKLGFHFTDNKGRLLENMVFIELKRRGHEIFYHQGKGECDFVIRNGYAIDQAIQVCYAFENESTKKREVDGLIDALKEYKLNEGLILTLDYEERFIVDNLTIQILPIWKWLIDSQLKY